MNIKKVILSLVILIAIIIGIVFLIKHRDYQKNNPDVSNAIKGVVTSENVSIYSKPKESKKIEGMKLGENVYIIETVKESIDGTTREWYKVREVYEKKDKKGNVKKTFNKVGYILKSNVKYFELNTTSEYVLMSDVSKFDIINEKFKTPEEYEVYLLNHKFNYAYIRLGGRGYGDEGNFYTDPNYQIFIDACNYLGVPYGLYYIDEATNEEELDEEVEFVKDFISKMDADKKKMLCLPVCIDVEKYDKSVNARTKNIWDERGELLQKLTDKFKENGIESIIYSNGNMSSEYLDEVNADFWIAYYDREDKIPSIWVTDINWEKDDDESAESTENEDENGQEEEEEEKEDNEEKFKYEHFTENELLVPKIVAWQFSNIGAKKDGITLKVDLSIVKNEFFQKFISDKNINNQN